MRKVLITKKTCGPCFALKSRLTKEKIKVEIKEYEEDPEFFQEHDLRFVPRLLVMDGDNILEEVQGSDDIIERIKK